jgi:hypothetical protein
MSRNEDENEIIWCSTEEAINTLSRAHNDLIDAVHRGFERVHANERIIAAEVAAGSIDLDVIFRLIKELDASVTKERINEYRKEEEAKREVRTRVRRKEDEKIPSVEFGGDCE